MTFPACGKRNTQPRRDYKNKAPRIVSVRQDEFYLVLNASTNRARTFLPGGQDLLLRFTTIIPQPDLPDTIRSTIYLIDF